MTFGKLKINKEQSREIYEMSLAPGKKRLSNVEIGKKFGITERNVRYHIQLWEDKLLRAERLSDSLKDIDAREIELKKTLKENLQVQPDISPGPLNTVEIRQNAINHLKSLAVKAEGSDDLKTAVASCRAIIDSCDSLDRRNGIFDKTAIDNGTQLISIQLNIPKVVRDRHPEIEFQEQATDIQYQVVGENKEKSDNHV